MSQTTISNDVLKTIFNQVDSDTQQIILDLNPTLLDTPRVDSGWVLSNINPDHVSDFMYNLNVDRYNDTDLVEVVNNTASGDESGHGFYLHRQGGTVAWYASPTKKGKAVRLVPVYTGSNAEQHLIDLGYTQL